MKSMSEILSMPRKTAHGGSGVLFPRHLFPLLGGRGGGGVPGLGGVFVPPPAKGPGQS